jgi:hypothetical protein
MAEQNHFKYEGVAKLHKGNQSMEVLDVSFLTPARIKFMVVPGVSEEASVNIDIVNRKVYHPDGEYSEIHTKEVFAYLDRVNELPGDMFEADQAIYDAAGDAKSAHDNLNSTGGI